MTGKAGVAIATSGPGVSNLVTGLATANSEGDPVVALGGAVATDEALKQIIRLKLGKIQRRLAETHKIALEYGDDLLNEVASRCTEVESGARNVDNILSNTMLPDLSRQILSRLAEGVAANKVSVSVKDGALTYEWDVAS